MTTLADEVDAYLGRGRYERGGGFRGYRNGTSPRRLTLGSGTVALDTPRVRDVPRGQEPFESKIIRKYQRRSDTIDETFMNLFVEGLATRAFEPSLRLLMGEHALLSPSVISRLTQRFKSQYETFDRRDLSDQKFVCVWADGIYLKAGLGTEKACLLVLIGADIEGQEHLIALREGYRESAASWGELLRDCRTRGMNEPACWIADGALGVWAAVNEHCPESKQQRCTNHFGDERDRQAADVGTPGVCQAVACDLAGGKRVGRSESGCEGGPRSVCCRLRACRPLPGG